MYRELLSAPLPWQVAAALEGLDDSGDSCLPAAAAFPGATPKLAVFAQGLAGTDDSWRRRAGDCAPYGDRLRAEFGYTPIYVRYNTGQHVSGTGHDLP